MPNIEIHGFGFFTSMLQFAGTNASKLYSAIRKRLNKQSFRDEFVLTIVPSACFNGKEKAQPFVRICSSEADHTERIIEILKKIQKKEGIKFDIEVQPLARFIPAEKKGGFFNGK